jgi:hypothetical protein
MRLTTCFALFIVDTFAMGNGVPLITNSSSCAVTTSFLPQAKQNYKAVFQAGANRCTALLYRVSGSGDEPNSLVPEPSAQRTMAPCVNNLTH